MKGLLALLIIMPAILALDCELPSEIQTPVTGNVTICTGQYMLLNPIEVSGDGDLTCKDVILNGSDGLAGVIISGRASVSGCTFEGFKIAVAMKDASQSSVVGNTFENNEIAVLLSDSHNNTIMSNTFMDNAGAIMINNSILNRIYANDLYPTGLLDVTDNLNIYCVDGISNTYHNEEGPGCKENTGIPANATANETIVSNRNETLLNATQIDMLPIEEVVPVKLTSLAEESEIMKTVLLLEGSGDNLDDLLAKRLEQVKAAHEAVSIKKNLVIDRKAKRTTVRTTISVKKKIKDLYIYEYIPKCVAMNIDELIFATPPTKVLQKDPIVVWHFPNANAGDNIELSYDVKKQIEIVPETVVVTHEINVTSKSECSESPASVPSLEVQLLKKNLIPLLIVPLLVIGYLYFSRFRKHFK